MVDKDSSLVNAPKVSVCITTYNLAAYIRQTLDSVLMQQTSFGFEILVGDDCSTDDTRNILLQYQAKYPQKIRLHFQEKNVGVNRQDYDLIQMARGEYIAWLDGDDYWITTDKLEKEAKILDEHKEFSCVHTSWRDYYQADGTEKDIHNKPCKWESTLKGKEYVERFLLQETSGCRLSSIMYRKCIIWDYLQKNSDVYLKVPHFQNDFVLFCILSYYGPFYHLDEITTVYRVLDKSLSHNTGYKQFKYSLGYLHAVVHLMKVFKVSSSVVQQGIHGTIGGLLPFIVHNLEYKEDLSEIQMICKSVGYKFSLGQKMFIFIINLSSHFHP